MLNSLLNSDVWLTHQKEMVGTITQTSVTLWLTQGDVSIEIRPDATSTDLNIGNEQFALFNYN
jgi:hypothetical protein